MSEAMILIFLLAGIVVMMFVFMIIKDTATAKRLRIYEDAIETLNKNLYALEKKVKASPSDDFAEIIAQELAPVTQSLVHALKEIQENNLTFQHATEGRLRGLEERYKTLFTPSSDTGADENRIITLYQQGASIEEIARDLRTTAGSVEFVLKLNGLGE